MNRPWMPHDFANHLVDTVHLNAAQSGTCLHFIMHRQGRPGVRGAYEIWTDGKERA